MLPRRPVILYEIDPDGDVVIELTEPEDSAITTPNDDYDEDLFDDLMGDDHFMTTYDTAEEADDDIKEAWLEEDIREVERQPFSSTNYGEKGFTKKQKPRSCYKVSKKPFILASMYFKTLFWWNSWTQGPQDRLNLIAHWSPKAFKILMEIAHLQFFKIPDRPGINTMVNIVMAADYLLMLPLLNPWVLRWGYDIPDRQIVIKQSLDENRSDGLQEYYMKLLYVSLHLGHTKNFREAFNGIVNDSDGSITNYGLPVPSNLTSMC